MTDPRDINAISRRDFLARSARAGAAIVATGVVGYWLYDRTGPNASSATDLVSLPDFSVPQLGPKMSIVTGADRVKTINRAFDSLGGIEQFIKRGDRVLLKVNAAFASPPALGATSHPQLVAEIVRLCLQAGAVSVVVSDNPINDPQSCFRLTGLAEAAQTAGARLFLPQDQFFKPTTVRGGALIKNWPLLYEPFHNVNKLIGIAPVKDHHRSGASMSMKNWYGLMGGRRNIFHQDIHNIIKELAMLVTPTLVVLDGTITMMSNGPTGGSLDDLKQTNTMIVSTDQVAADAFGATLLGKTAADLPYIAKAATAGRGTPDYESLKPARDHVD
ncbi:MAG TPA: DUF362 domain-containing protein [Verrucomicrobiae bacterium]|nr:DUF362 domain-containing protein [Verrucomicrobiae bacterium]